MPTCMTVESRGYTLLEVLMVLFIIGLSIGAMLGPGLATTALDQAGRLERFDHEYRLVAQTAVLEGRNFALDFHTCSASGDLCWRWLEQQTGAWQPVEDIVPGFDSVGAAGFAGSQAELRLEGLLHTPEAAAMRPGEPVRPEVWVYASRETTAFSLQLENAAGEEDFWQVDGMGRSGNDAMLHAPL